MQTTSLRCASNPIFNAPISLFNPLFFSPPPKRELSAMVSTSSRVQLPFHLVQNHRKANFMTNSAAVEELAETINSESELVEIGFLCGVHGLQGEISVKPSTDFPELRFSKPGRRWLRQQVSGRKKIQEVELVEGRPHHGQKSWILKFRGIDTVDEVKQLVGSTLLAKEEDRPEMEEGEFYSRDLVGMRVLLKETGQLVGTVANVYNSGASDLLQVMLDSSTDVSNGSSESKSIEAGQTGPLVWIPFVEAIVPDVDVNKREMHITPPMGLLELNLRSDDRSKKERRQLEWKERKKFQKRLLAAKKKLCELEQQHVFDGFRFGEKSERNLLAEQIVGVNSKLLRQALQNTEKSSKRWDLIEQINDVRAKMLRSTLKISQECLGLHSNEDKLGDSLRLLKQGQNLLSEGKVSLCLVLKDLEKQHQVHECDDLPELESSKSSLFSYLQEFLLNDQRFLEDMFVDELVLYLKEEDRAQVPLVLVCPMHAIQSLQKLFMDNDYFGFEVAKVWFLEEERLPVVCSSSEERKKHKILMKSPWEILQSPVGSAGIISLLSSHSILENLSDLGIDYIQICSVNATQASFNSILLGFVNAKEAELGVQIHEDSQENLREKLNVIFTVSFMRKLTKQMDKLQFYAVQKLHSHVERVDKEWVDVVPFSPNSLELRASIYSCLNLCSSNQICLLEITE